MNFSLLKKATLLSLCFVAGLSLYSFKVKSLGDDFLKQLGMTKTGADEKIANSILGGSIDAYGVKNAKNIIMGNRSAVTKDLLLYTKSYLQSAGFKKEYEKLKQNEKPTFEMPKTPDESKKEMIDAIKKMITDSEASAKKADATMKPIFEKLVVDGKKELAKAEDPANKQFARYEKNYPQLLKDIEKSNAQILMAWEAKYPANPMLFVKPRLEDFLAETKDIDFGAAVTIKNGKKIFVNPEYERKSNRWKMAFRAGKEVVEPARAFVQQWLEEIK